VERINAIHIAALWSLYLGEPYIGVFPVLLERELVLEDGAVLTVSPRGLEFLRALGYPVEVGNAGPNHSAG
jgi:hypothetical protein